MSKAIFKRLAVAMGSEALLQAELASEALEAQLRERKIGVADARVLVAYGGGKDSTYGLAFVRLIQLAIEERSGETFELVTVTNRHAGMPPVVMQNVEACFRALEMDSESSDLLVVDGHEVRPFSPNLPLPDHVIRRNRADVLLAGHRTQGDPRPTFCSACNLSMLSAFMRAAQFGSGVDLIITGDSPAELLSYQQWVGKSSERLGVATAGEGVVDQVRSINQCFYEDLHGTEGGAAASPGRDMPEMNLPRATEMFSIFDYTAYEAGAHWNLLEFVGFRFDSASLAFSFTETDCANPSLMAHLRALKAERLLGRDYESGFSEYLDFAVGLMEKKQFPEHLVEEVRSKYDTAAARRVIRAVLTRHAEATFGLTEAQLVAMLFSPFAGQGQGLGDWIAAESPPGVADAEAVRALLAGDGKPVNEPEVGLLKSLRGATGLSLAQMRHLYRSEFFAPSKWAAGDPKPAPGTSSSPLAVLLDGDPHRATVRTREHGTELNEILSGR